MPQLPTIQPELVPDEQTALATIAQQNSLQPETAHNLQSSFGPLFLEARSIIEKSRTIVVVDEADKVNMKVSREFRLGLRSIRVKSEKLRKDLKEESLRTGKAIDGFNSILLHLIETEEKRLEDGEKYVERLAAQKKAALSAKREEQLRVFNIDTSFYSLGEMSEFAFQQLLSNTIAAHEKRQEDARRIELERIEHEKADLAERQRVKAENERLRQEAVAKEEALRVEREKVKAEQKAAEELRQQELAREREKARADREAVEFAAHAERQRMETVRIAAEAKRAEVEETNRKERLRLQALAEVERQKHESARQEAERIARIEREAREKAEAELKRARDLEAKKKAAELAAARKLAAAPDRLKFQNLAATIAAAADDWPEMKTEDGRALAMELIARLETLAAWLKGESDKL